ncbi:MAG: phenylacetate-CoA oxygenase subunit PaaC [Actinomycetota bacterium]|nr:phenylacetate-CoA oxygenase subunit PaaC [Actinomycetota bacterium]
MSEALVSLLTALADDELILGHRHSEWTGFAPHIEEDVAFSSIAQDEIGHAAALYGILAQRSGGDADGLALGRDAAEYRHAVLCERPNRDWAYTLARHWVYDTADAIRLEALGDTADEELKALVTKMSREERYHLIHADAWIERVGAGPVEGRMKLEDGLNQAFEEALGLFEPIQHEEKAVYEGYLPVPSSELARRFRERAANKLDELGVPTEIDSRSDESAEFVASSSGDLIASGDNRAPAPHERARGLGGRAGHHSEEFDELWNVMTSTYRNNPGATW